MELLVSKMRLGEDGVWGDVSDYGKQEEEKTLRQSVANQSYRDYLLEISSHHSIPVMDHQVQKFLNRIPQGGVILDVGGCWGWHWRSINNQRPDITIVIVDLIRENLLHAKEVLKDMISNNQVLLVHGNACSLEFEDETFDGIWSVQTTQHIPDFEIVCTEIFRILKRGGIYWDYGFNNAHLIRFFYKLFGKTYHLDGVIPGKFYLRRFNYSVIKAVNNIFHAQPYVQYSEVLFTPEFGLPIGGKENSILGNLDSLFTGKLILWRLVARQCSFHVQKHDQNSLNV